TADGAVDRQRSATAVEGVVPVERDRAADDTSAAFVEDRGAVLEHDFLVQRTAAQSPEFQGCAARDGDRLGGITDLSGGSLNGELALEDVDIADRGINCAEADERDLIGSGLRDVPRAAGRRGGERAVADVPAIRAAERGVAGERDGFQRTGLGRAAVDNSAIPADAGTGDGDGLGTEIDAIHVERAG